MVTSILLYCFSSVGFDPTVRSAVDEKNSFSLSGSIVSRFGFGWRIQWITFHTSLDFFDDKSFLVNSLLAFFIDDLSRFLTSRNFFHSSSFLLFGAFC